MIYRLWTTKVDPARVGEYREFARDRSLPMFRVQKGFLEATFLEAGDDEHWVLTVWETAEDVRALAASPSYLATARALVDTGLLVGAQSTRILRPEA